MGVSGRENTTSLLWPFFLMKNVFFKIAKQITVEVSSTYYKMGLKRVGYNIYNVQVWLFCR